MDDIFLPELVADPVNNQAYVWLLMKSNTYLPGVFTSMFSVLKTNPKADLVLMYTEDMEDHIEIIKKITPHLCLIPYLTFETSPLISKRQNTLYKTWKSSSYTKWNCLALPYEKVILLDADTITTENIDHLFDLPCPSAPFSSPYIEPLGEIRNYCKGEKDSTGYLEHGQPVKKREIKKMLWSHGNLLTASTILIKPSMQDFSDYLDMMKKKQPFGTQKTYSMVDEQSIVMFYVLEKNQIFHNIHHRYNYISWKEGYLNTSPIIIHYFSDTKPWQAAYDLYPDFKLWYEVATAALEFYSILPDDIMLNSNNMP